MPVFAVPPPELSSHSSQCKVLQLSSQAFPGPGSPFFHVSHGGESEKNNAHIFFVCFFSKA